MKLYKKWIPREFSNLLDGCTTDESQTRGEFEIVYHVHSMHNHLNCRALFVLICSFYANLNFKKTSLESSAVYMNLILFTRLVKLIKSQLMTTIAYCATV
jgi:hypothetical protein